MWAGLDALAVVVLRPDAGTLADGLGAPRAWLARAGTDGALATCAGAGLWLAAVWLAVGLAATAAAALPGWAGRAGARLSRVLLPALVRRAVSGTAGLGLLLAPVVAPAVAGANPPTAPRGAPVGMHVGAFAPGDPLPAPSWPTTGAPAGMHTGTPSLPAPSWPRSPQPPPIAAPAPTQAPAPARPAATVRVRPGDSLWLIAARRLGPHADVARVAHTWPRWYAANRTAVGADPDHLVPGTVLHAPPADPQEAR